METMDVMHVIIDKLQQLSAPLRAIGGRSMLIPPQPTLLGRDTLSRLKLITFRHSAVQSTIVCIAISYLTTRSLFHV